MASHLLSRALEQPSLLFLSMNEHPTAFGTIHAEDRLLNFK